MTVAGDRVALVLVSHSRALAEGVAALARQMVGEDVKVICAAGSGEGGAELGTDATRILEAITAADNPAGTIVFMDLGSAILSTEMALELAGPELRERVSLSAAPFVEGAVTAAVAAAGGAARKAILGEADRALEPKAGQLQAPVDAAPTIGLAEGATQSVGHPHQHEAAAIADAVIRDPHGLHARPAGRVAALAGKFDAEITIANRDNGKGPADAKSLVALMSLGAGKGHRLRIAATGSGATEAASALRKLIEGFTGDASPAPIDAGGQRSEGPIPVSPGVAIGPLFVFERRAPAVSAETVADPQAELARLETALGGAINDLEKKHASATEAEIAAMQTSLLRDPILLAAARRSIAKDRLNAAAAFERAADDAAKVYRALEDPYLRAREADLSDVSRAVIGKLLGLTPPILREGQPVILLADEIAPSEVLGLDRNLVLGVIDRRGGPTSHAAILLRSLGIPAIAGSGPFVPLAGARTVAFDGGAGEIAWDPTDEEAAPFARRRSAWLARHRNSSLKDGRVRTLDGTTIEIWANVASLAETRAAREADAFGIGLLRTEIMFLDRETAPSEEEQAAKLREIFDVFARRPIVVRTLDAGGDKPIPYMNMPREMNPYLGLRGLRLSLREAAIFETQLRAILRAGAGHDVRIMLPMVTEPSEVEAASASLARAHAALERDMTASAWPVSLGIMVEVPAAAITAKQLSRVSEFFSIGTNDLTQYALAAERGNPSLGRFADAAHPAVLALVEAATRAAAEADIPISVCGEAAGDEATALLLAGLGVRKLSMAAPAIPFIAGRLQEVDLSSLLPAGARALRDDTAQQAREEIGQYDTVTRRERRGDM
jgi:multiphosphoryl transfer protein